MYKFTAKLTDRTLSKILLVNSSKLPHTSQTEEKVDRKQVPVFGYDDSGVACPYEAYTDSSRMYTVCHMKPTTM